MLPVEVVGDRVVGTAWKKRTLESRVREWAPSWRTAIRKIVRVIVLLCSSIHVNNLALFYLWGKSGICKYNIEWGYEELNWSQKIKHACIYVVIWRDETLSKDNHRGTFAPYIRIDIWNHPRFCRLGPVQWVKKWSLFSNFANILLQWTEFWRNGRRGPHVRCLVPVGLSSGLENAMVPILGARIV